MISTLRSQSLRILLFAVFLANCLMVAPQNAEARFIEDISGFWLVDKPMTASQQQFFGYGKAGDILHYMPFFVIRDGQVIIESSNGDDVQRGGDNQQVYRLSISSTFYRKGNTLTIEHRVWNPGSDSRFAMVAPKGERAVQLKVYATDVHLTRVDYGNDAVDINFAPSMHALQKTAFLSPDSEFSRWFMKRIPDYEFGHPAWEKIDFVYFLATGSPETVALFLDKGVGVTLNWPMPVSSRVVGRTRFDYIEAKRKARFEYNDPPGIRQMLERGAVPQLPSDTPFEGGADFRKKRLFESMNIMDRASGARITLEELSPSDADTLINSRSLSGLTALERRVMEGNYRAAAVLVKAGGDPETVDRCGMTVRERVESIPKEVRALNCVSGELPDLEAALRGEEFYEQSYAEAMSQGCSAEVAAALSKLPHPIAAPCAHDLTEKIVPPPRLEPPVGSAMATIKEFIAKTKVDKSQGRWKSNLTRPPKLAFRADQKYFWILQTNKGTFKIELMPDVAPMHVSSTIYLTLLGFYDDTIFHRIIPGMMAQGGDPSGTGRGGPGYKYRGELNHKVRHDKAGILGMVNAGPNSEGSQFYLTFAKLPHLDDKHTTFGSIVEGLDRLKELEALGNRRGTPTEKVSIEKASISVE